MRTVLNAARLVAIAGAIAVGSIVVLIAFMVGDCSAFGGACPRETTPLFEDDTFGTAAAGAALAVGVPVFLRAPSWRRFAVAAVAAISAGLLVGLVVRWSAAN